jgi:hypothetical protein
VGFTSFREVEGRDVVRNGRGAEVRGFGVPHRGRSLRGSCGIPRSPRLLRTEDRESDRWLSGDVVQFATPPLSSSSPTAELTTTFVSPPLCSFSSARWPDLIQFGNET